MNWKTIYITGKNGFYDEVLKNLHRSDITFMPGYHTRDLEESHELFWIPDQMDLREFKLAVGAKAIWKYRLKFHFALEEFAESMNETSLTDEELKKVQAMRRMDSAA